MSLLDEYTVDDLVELIKLAEPDEAALLADVLQAELRALNGQDEYFPTARAEQRPPDDDWATWVLLSGRGFGKTRVGAEWVVDEATKHLGSYAIAAPTYGDGRDICIEGESGVRSVLERRGRWNPRAWNRSLGELVLDNGSRLKVGSADEPDRFRGWNFAGAWCDELAAWRRPDAWTQLRLATRLGRSRIVVTTTPRPVKLVKNLVERDGKGVTITRGSTFDNAANLSTEYLDEVRTTYEGTRIGRQELYGELLTDTPGALWVSSMIEPHRLPEPEYLKRVVVAIDPAVTSGDDSDSTGIIAAGMAPNGHIYVLADRTLKASPERWCRAAVDLYDEVKGDRIVGEVNNGGDLVETVLRMIDSSVPYSKVHASKGKRVRAEPVAALYERGLVHHVGDLAALEDQLTTWTADSGESPDRLDALVWAITELAIESHPRRRRSIVDVSAA